MRTLITLAITLALPCAAGAFGDEGAENRSLTGFRTARIQRADLRPTVRARGTLQPEEVVDIGTQVAGPVVSFGDDPRGNGKRIDYGSPVEKGTVLCRIDGAVYQAKVEQARADVQRAEAELRQTASRLRKAQVAWRRAKDQKARDIIDPSTAELAQADYETAKAAVDVARAGISQARAKLRLAEIRLAATTIRSPIKGIVIDRRVDVGQTVATGPGTPSLFLIGKDFKKLQVWASVHERDIGPIKPGLRATFTVDAIPGRVFKGVVAPDQPRLNAQLTKEGVMYTVLVQTDNADGKLLPYLTADVQIELPK
jgi:HlyD family secretion protein